MGIFVDLSATEIPIKMQGVTLNIGMMLYCKCQTAVLFCFVLFFERDVAYEGVGSLYAQ